MLYRKSILLILVVGVFLLPQIGSTTMIITGGGITHDTVWTSDDTIRVVSSVAVAADVSLTIQPGTVVLFNPAIDLQVFGELYANGEDGHEIILTSINDTTGGNPYPGNWQGVYFLEQSSGIVKYCHIRYPNYGFMTVSAKVEFYNCTAENFSVFGFYLNGVLAGSEAPIIMDHCLARQEEPAWIGRGTGINVYQKTDITIAHCRIYNCQIGIDLNAHSFAYPTFDIIHCDIHNNLIYGILVESCG
jgi:hypothetical protein